MTDFTIVNEDQINIQLGGSSLEIQLSKESLNIEIDGAKKLELGIELNPVFGGTTGPVEEALSAKVLQTKLIASETISALRLVYQTSPSEAGLADYQNASKKDAVGIALTSATVGNEVVVLYFGRVVDAFFNFPLNDSLFLGNNGIVTNVPPVSDYSVRIGKSLGAGAILIKIERPIIL